MYAVTSLDTPGIDVEASLTAGHALKKWLHGCALPQQ